MFLFEKFFIAYKFLYYSLNVSFRPKYDACITTQTVTFTQLAHVEVQIVFPHVVDTSMILTRAKRAWDADREAKRAIPRANALLLEGSPERVQVSQGPRFIPYPCRTPR